MTDTAPADLATEARIRRLEGRMGDDPGYPGRRALRTDPGRLADLEARYAPAVVRGECRCPEYNGLVIHSRDCILFWLAL